MHLLFEFALRVMPRPVGVLRATTLLTVTVTPLYGGDRYVHHNHGGAPAARMRQKTRLPPVPAACRTRADPLTGYPTPSRLPNSYGHPNKRGISCRWR
jgi:hypothetical protein